MPPSRPLTPGPTPALPFPRPKTKSLGHGGHRRLGHRRDGHDRRAVGADGQRGERPADGKPDGRAGDEQRDERPDRRPPGPGQPGDVEFIGLQHGKRGGHRGGGRIRNGLATRMLAGGSEGASPYIWAGFDAMRVICRKFNDRPEQASRPMSATPADSFPGRAAPSSCSRNWNRPWRGGRGSTPRSWAGW